MWRRLQKFWSDRAGVAVVEMALIAPVIAAVGLVSFQLWQSAGHIEDMRTALKAGGQYYMNGGTSDSAAHTLAMSSWERPPADAAITVSRSCFCGITAQVCSTQCADGSQATVFVTLAATATDQGSPFHPNLAAESVVRVR